ncbi:MAG: hypothetical protein QXZ43_04630 [Candidatus Aenigmatarchaeota archaeon]
MDKSLIKILGILATLLALIAPFSAKIGIDLAATPWILLLLGVVIGSTISHFDLKFFVSVIALFSITSLFVALPVFGNEISEILRNFAILGGGILAIPALKLVLERIGIKI